jgi:hypothetical protein
MEKNAYDHLPNNPPHLVTDLMAYPSHQSMNPCTMMSIKLVMVHKTGG